MEATTQVEILANLRRSFKKHLLEHGKGIAEANVICNDAFFLANQNLPVSFENFLECGLTEEIKNCIIEYFLLSGNREYAQNKAEQYFRAMSSLYEFYITTNAPSYKIIGTNKGQGILMAYCQKMRLQYSYKPLLLLSLLETGSINGTTTVSEAVLYFINFYNDRLEKGLVSEKADSIFSRKGVAFADARQNILSNAIKVLEKDGVLLLDGELIRLAEDYLYDYHHHRSEVTAICKEILSSYYSKISSDNLNEGDQEVMLGSVLQRMHSNASNSEKVIMVQLFGIKYGELIESNRLSIKSIIAYSGVPSSYYFEVRKGVVLSRYVELKDTPLSHYKEVSGISDSNNSISKAAEKAVSVQGDDSEELEFLEKCYGAIEARLNCGPLEKRKRQIRVDKLGKTAVLYTSSKSYLRKDSDPFFWFGFHRHQQQALNNYLDSYIAFVLKDDKQCILMPTEFLYKWLSYMSQTEKANDFYWHLHIYKVNGRYLLNVPSKDKVDISNYCLF